MLLCVQTLNSGFGFSGASCCARSADEEPPTSPWSRVFFPPSVRCVCVCVCVCDLVLLQSPPSSSRPQQAVQMCDVSTLRTTRQRIGDQTTRSVVQSTSAQTDHGLAYHQRVMRPPAYKSEATSWQGLFHSNGKMHASHLHGVVACSILDIDGC